jgi:hypothetical protein
MKGERKLRLVSGGKGPAPDLPEGEEPPFTDEELAAAAARRDHLGEGVDPLAGALRAAYAPAPLGPVDLDAIVTRALGDESAATRAEIAAAERLRAELDGEGGESAGPDAEILRAMRLAASPTDLAPERHEAILEAALRAPLRRRISGSVRRLSPVTMAALTGVAALAAGLALFVGRPTAPADRPAATAALVRARSADGLFDAATPFPRSGQESARIDRIASARAADLRQNRFAAWGVR